MWYSSINNKKGISSCSCCGDSNLSTKTEMLLKNAHLSAAGAGVAGGSGRFARFFALDDASLSASAAILSLACRWAMNRSWSRLRAAWGQGHRNSDEAGRKCQVGIYPLRTTIRGLRGVVFISARRED